jgi:hypothetical protein
MVQLLERSYSAQDFSELVTKLLGKKNKLAVVMDLEKDPKSGEVHVGVRKVYSDEVEMLASEIDAEFDQKEQAGYSREDAVRDFRGAQKEAVPYLESTS